MMVRYSVRLFMAFGVLSGVFSLSGAQAGPLNDTGIDFCRDHASGADTAVSATTTCQPQQ
ncbi:MAG: hypothetical protein WAT70_00270 [Rhizobiaceae bacterium]